MNEGRPVIIEAENQNTNDEIGRVVGEAVRQTFHSLSNQVQGTQPTDQQNQTTTSSTTTTTTTTTRSENGQVVEREHSQRHEENGLISQVNLLIRIVTTASILSLLDKP